MTRTKLSSKGQVILPIAVRREHHWRPGTEFTVESIADGVLLRAVANSKPTRIEDVYGCLPYRGRAKTVAEMDAAITAELKARRARGRY